MNSFISDLAFVIFVVVVNSISLTFFILFQFNVCHGVAALTAIIISICIFFLEFFIKRRNNETSLWIKYCLLSFMVLGGAIGFLWFFYLLYRLFNYDGDTLDLLLKSVTPILALGIAVHLIIVSHIMYVKVTNGRESSQGKVCTITESREELCSNFPLP
ncbi:hypothetical protein RN001_013904 [Aquatica leii]|uniref:Uncharacterized protein n=1 Tax=Aquatica leii TaxID=1421715 RepID=A0AAN7SE72_9COLE|nr:hypothetical protein RN001_013904 [Aquatica leii]